MILKSFSEANGDRVLLARGGKDILATSVPCATALIRCGPWGNRSWEENAERLIHNISQTRSCYVYQILTRGCLVEDMRSRA